MSDEKKIVISLFGGAPKPQPQAEKSQPATSSKITLSMPGAGQANTKHGQQAAGQAANNSKKIVIGIKPMPPSQPQPQPQAPIQTSVVAEDVEMKEQPLEPYQPIESGRKQTESAAGSTSIKLMMGAPQPKTVQAPQETAPKIQIPIQVPAPAPPAEQPTPKIVIPIMAPKPPAEPKTMIPAEPKIVIPAEPKIVIPAESKMVIPAEPKIVIPAEPKIVIPAEPKKVIPAEPKIVIPAEPIQQPTVQQDAKIVIPLQTPAPVEPIIQQPAADKIVIQPQVNTEKKIVIPLMTQPQPQQEAKIVISMPSAAPTHHEPIAQQALPAASEIDQAAAVQVAQAPPASNKISIPLLMQNAPQTPQSQSEIADDNEAPMSLEPSLHDELSIKQEQAESFKFKLNIGPPEQPLYSQQVQAAVIQQQDIQMGEPDQIPQSQPIFQTPVVQQVQKQSKHSLFLTELYDISHRQLSLKLNQSLTNFTAQLIVSFELKANVVDLIQSLQDEHYTKASIELKLLAKHCQITDVWELNGVDRAKRFAFNDQQQHPQYQAQEHGKRFESNEILQINDIQELERNNYNVEQFMQGTCQLKRKLFGLKLQKYPAAQLVQQKLKPRMRLLIEYKCDQITQGSTLRAVHYSQASQAAQQEKSGIGRYLYTVPQQPECWLPQILGAMTQQSPWQLRFVCPHSYMVVASGVQTQRLKDSTDALHVYDVPKAASDKIGFACLPMPNIKQVENARAPRGTYACFLPQSKKDDWFVEQYVCEVQDYMMGLIGVNDYPCKQVHFVFLPNLFAKKFPLQSVSFAEGLHLLDEQILFRPNQIDKRHHLYKQLAGAITFDFFGSKVREQTPGDAWLITGIRERIGDRMKRKKCGLLLHKYQVMRSIEKLYKQIKHGAETFPLQPKDRTSEDSSQIPHEQQLSDIFYRKCGLLMHMIESSIDEPILDKILRSIYVDAIENKDGQLSQFEFRKKFKKICGMKPENYYKNWIWSTSCPELELSYEFNKRHNNLDLTLRQMSAVQYGQTEHQNLSRKMDRIFTSQNQQGELQQPLDNLFLDIKQAACRFFCGHINIVIYQIEGNGGEIIQQQHKMALKEDRSTSKTQLNLQGRVKRTMNHRKRDDQVYTIEQKMQNDFGQFKMNEFELEDYPHETKNIFQDLDNSNPVLWIRVDPDMEFIRKVKIVQDKRNNWLFQLLREQDIIGQIEAVRRLHVYNEFFVYEILKTVARSENFFYKIRKEVLKALQKMEIYTFNQHLSTERYLFKLFNTNRMLPGDSVSTFYRENDFTNILEYYMERALLKAISKCKEEHLRLTPEKDKEVQEKKDQRIKQVAAENGTQKGNPDEKDTSEPIKDSNMISLPIIDNKIIRTRRLKQRFDDSLYRCTTESVARMLLQVLEQNDNSQNDFDDSFYLRDVIASLGRLDNIRLMPEIATEIHRQFKLDQISNSSPQFAITIGAIKAYFNLQKQLFKFRTEKQPNLLIESDQAQCQLDSLVSQVSSKLQEMKVDIDKIFMDASQPLHLRQFIFNAEVKNLFKYKSQSFSEALLLVLQIIDNLQQRGQLVFAFYALRDTVVYLEQKKFVGGCLNFLDAYQTTTSQALKKQMWNLYRLPHAYLTCEFTYWTKRLIKRIYSHHIPECEHLNALKPDDNWTRSEAEHIQLNNQQQAELAQQHQAQQQQALQASTMQQHQPQKGVKVQIGGGPRPTETTKQPTQTQQQLIQLNTGSTQQAQKEVPKPSQQPLVKVTDSGAFKIQIGLGQPPQGTGFDDDDEDDDYIMMSDGSDQADKPATNFYQGQQQVDMEDDDESIYDQFAAEVQEDPTMQQCWLVLGKLFYDEWATDFLDPITLEAFGQEMYDDYCSVIQTPMDISTIIDRMKGNYYMLACQFNPYSAKELFRREVLLIFQNCKDFNERGSDIVQSANRMLRLFNKLWIEYGLG